jgi:hypothetical protein
VGPVAGPSPSSKRPVSLATWALGALFCRRCEMYPRNHVYYHIPFRHHCMRSDDILVKVGQYVGSTLMYSISINKFLKGVKGHHIFIEGKMHP